MMLLDHCFVKRGGTGFVFIEIKFYVCVARDSGVGVRRATGYGWAVNGTPPEISNCISRLRIAIKE